MNKRILRFTASWCNPCKMLAKNLELTNSKVPIEVVDIDVLPEIAVDFGIRSVPTLVMMDGNIEMKRFSGMKTTKQIEDWLND
jgi:thioredoxin-like negative regulator of GroEL